MRLLVRDQSTIPPRSSATASTDGDPCDGSAGAASAAAPDSRDIEAAGCLGSGYTGGSARAVTPFDRIEPVPAEAAGGELPGTLTVWGKTVSAFGSGPIGVVSVGSISCAAESSRAPERNNLSAARSTRWEALGLSIQISAADRRV